MKNKVNKKSFELLNDPKINKGTSFDLKERTEFKLNGLLPPKISNLKDQINRAYENFKKKPNDLEKYIFLTELQNRNETLYFRLIIDNIEEMMPIIYTPTVGDACKHYGHIYRRPKGLYISYNFKGKVKSLLKNWANNDIEIIVCTDGERILGLGDLGANGMGIPVGKLVLYTICAGINPNKCLPITIDVGTNNQKLIDDPMYLGLSHRRIQGSKYEDFIDEVISSLSEVFPESVIQFEDFANKNASYFLQKYKYKYRKFNDDIQGTGCVVLAGILSAMRKLETTISKQKILFYGAGSASIGIANLICKQVLKNGYGINEARKNIFLFDSKGLVTKDRKNLNKEKKPYMKDLKVENSLLNCIKKIKPTILIGASGIKNAFTPNILQEMKKINDTPIIFALSNPTANSECTAKDVLLNTKGKAIFSSGSPFKTIINGGKEFHTSQANNAYVFPGIGLGVLLSKVDIITDDIFLNAAHTLSKITSDNDLKNGKIYPSINQIRRTSIKIAYSIASTYNKKITYKDIDNEIYYPNYK